MTIDKEKKRIVIKIGSSSLTSAHGEISRRKLERFVDEVVQLKDEGHEILLVSSGAVAAGYRKLGCLKRPESLPEKQAAASVGQGLLIESYSDLFLSHGYVASQILITRSDFSNETRYHNVRNTLNVLLERGIVPIVNENDTVTTDRLKFGDNDTLSAKVAGLVQADQLIILSDIEGLYDANPNTNKDAQLLKQVYEITPEIEAAAGDSGSEVGTGGMRSKIDAVRIAMASGILAFIGKAGTPDLLINAVSHKAEGTYFESASDTVNLNQKKQWIAFNSGPEGEIVIDANGKARCITHKKDLMLESVKDVIGRFEHGAVVKILDEEGTELGLGVANYASEAIFAYKLSEAKNLKDFEQSMIEMDHFVCHTDISIPASV